MVKIEDSFIYKYEDLTLEIFAMASAYIDSNYGADADGNRGERAIFIEGIDVKIFWEGKDVSFLILVLNKEVYDEIFTDAEELLNNLVFDEGYI